MGHGENLEPVLAGTVKHAEARVEIRRPDGWDTISSTAIPETGYLTSLQETSGTRKFRSFPGQPSIAANVGPKYIHGTYCWCLKAPTLTGECVAAVKNMKHDSLSSYLLTHNFVQQWLQCADQRLFGRSSSGASNDH